MQDNPYSPFVPVVDNFCGRNEFFTFLNDRLAESPPKKHVLITGIGGIGKTSILNKFISLKDSIENHHFNKIQGACFVNLESTGDDIKRVFSKISRFLSVFIDAKIYKQLKDIKNKLSINIGFPPSVSVSLAKPSADLVPIDFEDLYVDLLEKLTFAINRKFKLVFLFDQMEKILEWPSGNRRFCQNLWFLLQNTLNSPILFLISCRPDGKGDIEHYLSPGLFDPRYIDHFPIGALNQSESAELIQKPLRKYGSSFSSRIVQLITEQCKGHPYYLQLSCFHIWNHLLLTGKLASPEIILPLIEIEELLKESHKNIFNNYFNDYEKLILKTIALARIPISESEIIARVRVHADVSNSIIKETLNNLLKKHEYKPLKNEENKYAITHDIFCDYIRDNECLNEEKEIEIARSELSSKLLSWKLNIKSLFHSSALKLIGKYKDLLNLSKESLNIILLSEAKAGNLESIKEYIYRYGIDECKDVLYEIIYETDDEIIGEGLLKIFLSEQEYLISEAVYKFYKHPLDKVRIKSIEGIKLLSEKSLEPRKIKEAILLAIKHPNPQIRAAAINASIALVKANISFWKDETLYFQFIELLIGRLSDSSFEVASNACQHLELYSHIEKIYRRLFSIIAPNRATRPFAKTSNEAQKWELAIRAIDSNKDHSIRKELYKRIERAILCSEQAIQVIGIKYLRDQKDFNILELLSKFEDNKDLSDKFILTIIETLKNIRNEISAHLLSILSESSDIKIKTAAIEAMGQIGAISIPNLQKLIHSKQLPKITDDIRIVWEAVINAYIEIGIESKNILTSLLHHWHPLIRKLSIQGITKIPIYECRDLIRNLFTNETDIIVKREAAKALGKLNDKNSTVILAKYLAHKDPILRENALKSLKMLGNEAVREILGIFEKSDPQIYSKLREIINETDTKI